MKICVVCKEPHELSGYYKFARNKDGLHSMCKSCCKIASKAIREKNRAAISVQRAKYRANNKDKIRAKRLRYMYGITPDQYNKMLHSQGNKCGICNIDESNIKTAYKLFYVDHDHATNRIRGLLCNYCNSMLGFAKDNAENLLAGINYLRKK